MIQFAQAVGLKIALTSYCMLEEVLLKTRASQFAVSSPDDAGYLPYLSQCGSTVFESVASKSSYSLPTIIEVGEQSFASTGSLWGRIEQRNLLDKRPSVIPGGNTSVQQTAPKDLLALGQLRAKPVSKNRNVRKMRFAILVLLGSIQSPAEVWRRVDCFSLERCLSELHLPKFSPLNQSKQCVTSTVSKVCCISRMSRWLL